MCSYFLWLGVCGILFACPSTVSCECEKDFQAVAVKLCIRLFPCSALCLHTTATPGNLSQLQILKLIVTCMQVYANDLNPRSAFYMAKNVRINKVNSMVHVFNMDGREFVKLLCATPGGPADALLAQGQDPLHQQEQPDSGHTAAGGSGMPPKSKAEVTHGSQPAAQQGAADNAAPGTGAHSGSHPAASQPHTVQSEQGDVHDPSTSGQGQGIDGGSNSGSGQAGRRAARVGREADSQPPAMPAGWRPPPQAGGWGWPLCPKY